jgi:hypothetical protein
MSSTARVSLAASPSYSGEREREGGGEGGEGGEREGVCMYYLDSMPARDLPPCPQMGGGHVSLRGCGCTPTYQPPSLSVWPPTGALCVAAYYRHTILATHVCRCGVTGEGRSKGEGERGRGGEGGGGERERGEGEGRGEGRGGGERGEGKGEGGEGRGARGDGERGRGKWVWGKG